MPRGACRAALLATVIAGCGTAETDIDPGELGARDLLGIDPGVAAAWGGAERAAARRVLERAFDAPAGDPAVVPVIAVRAGDGPGEAARQALVRLDAEREALGLAPVMIGRLDAGAGRAEARVSPERAAVDLDGVVAPAGGAVLVVPVGWEEERAARWAGLPARGEALLVELAVLAGRPDDGRPLVVEPAPRLAVGAVWLAGDDVLLVNPVVLAALEPTRGGRDAPPAAGELTVPSDEPAAAVDGVDRRAAGTRVARSLGNPYSFYGSLGECSTAQRLRCEACLPTSACVAETRDASDGNSECMTLAADGGRGYDQLCVNVALAIRTVSTCVESKAPGCPQVFTAGNQLSALGANDAFLADPACVAALDACLSEIYGAPAADFGADAGPGLPPPPPRDVDVSCGDCDSDTSCNFDPQCDADCSSSCEGGSCGDCDSGSGGGGDSGGGCGTCDSGDSGGGGGGGDCGGGDCGGGDCGGGDCGGGDCGGGDAGDPGGGGGGGGCGGSGDTGCGSCDSGSSGGGGGCTSAGTARVTRRPLLLVSVAWAVLPLLCMGLVRRRELRRARRERRDEHGGGEA
jgi:hypothetical protein